MGPFDWTRRKESEIADTLMAHWSLFICDTIGMLSAEQIVRLRQRHTVKVLGAAICRRYRRNGWRTWERLLPRSTTRHTPPNAAL